jgi:4-coumarate--CoA ligase
MTAAFPLPGPARRSRTDHGRHRLVDAVLGPTPRDLLRPLVSLLADDLARQRGRPPDPAEWRGWGPDTTVDEDGLGVDSLARLELVSRVSRVFALHRSGVEDYLLLHRRLIDWAEIAREGLQRAPSHPGPALVFDSSGSTGRPSTASHALRDLLAEADAHAALLPGIRRIVSLVPPHHIYGFLFGVVGPQRRGLPLLDARGRPPGALLGELARGDLVVATPFLWELLARSGARLPAGVSGVTSTAPMPPRLWHRLHDLGLASLTEIYGATETGGLGARSEPEAPFRPLAHVELIPGPSPAFRRRRTGRRLQHQDRLAPAGRQGFRVLGRLDGAVQVGGHNVAPGRVAARLADHPAIAEAAVRLDDGGPTARLKALIVPAMPEVMADGPCEAAFLDGLRRWMRGRLAAPERPERLDLAPSLPRDAMGKPTDWR